MSRRKRLRKLYHRKQQQALPWISLSQETADEMGLTAEQLLDAITESEAAGFVEVEKGPLGIRVRMTAHGMSKCTGPVMAIPRHLAQQAAALEGEELERFLDQHAIPVPPEIENPDAN